MNRKRKLNEDKEIEGKINSELRNFSNISNDTEVAILFIKNKLLENRQNNLFPPVVFVHQLYDIIENKTILNRQIEILRNEKKIVLIHLGNENNMRVVIFFDDLKNHVISKRDLAEKSLFQKFFDKVLSSTSDIGISRLDLMIKFKFSEKDIRCLVNAGLLILNETNIFWFSFPSAGIFMRKFIKGRQTLINIIKKRKFGEILQSELEKLPTLKSVQLPVKYLIHDLVGGNFVKWSFITDCELETLIVYLAFADVNFAG
ncbi:hypothetical protein PGB90_005775 [Kerria lacca]